ncbi:MAG TPA: ATP-binding protein, partial [Planctomycetota bacterium]|nr:ATP-binding protein [Planctomycetota bacterium]
VAAFDFFFVEPTWTFTVSDSQYLVTFTVMLIVALLISSLTTRIRDQAEEARARERRTAALYAMSRELAAARGESEMLEIGARHVRETFDCSVAVLLPASGGQVAAPAADRTAYSLEPTDQGAAQWAFDHVQPSGAGTSTLPAAQGLYIPLAASQGKVGVLGVRPHGPEPFSPGQRHRLEAFASQLALALERARLIREAQESQVRAETERLRNALLSSVSHDLRTPLAVIQGAASTLLEGAPSLDEATRRGLADSIASEADRLNQIVNNLVFATRLESGVVDLRRDWIGVEEIVGSAIRRLKDRLRGRVVRAFVPADLPLVRADGVLLEQVVVNLLENAMRYTPEGTPIEISAWRTEAAVVVRVKDHGPGLATEEAQRVFDRFYRGRAGSGSSGLGLGLYICRGIVAAHGGRIWSESAPGGGASFLFTLPIEASPPEIAVEAPSGATPRATP